LTYVVGYSVRGFKIIPYHRNYKSGCTHVIALQWFPIKNTIQKVIFIHNRASPYLSEKPKPV